MSFYCSRDRISARRKSIKTIGSEKDLYKVSWAGFSDPYFIEKDIMSKGFDAPAARVRDAMLDSDINSLNTNEKKTFSAFLILLITRGAYSLHHMKTRGELAFSESFEGLSRTVDGVSHKMGETEAKELYERNFRGYGADLALHAMFENAVTSPHTTALNNLEWRIAKFDPNHPDLVIADHPVRMWGNGENLERLMMPISPNALFVAGTRQYFSDEPILREEFREILAIRCIVDQFRQADRFVVARNVGPGAGYLALAEKYMLRC